MQGGNEIRLEDRAGYEDNFKTLKADEVLIKDSIRQDLVCLHCQRVHENKIWVIKCPKCAELDYPIMRLIFGCLECGGEQKFLLRYKEHMRTHG